MAAQSPIMNVMIKAAEKAARSLLRDFGEVEQLQVSQKGPGDFVSAADKRSEQIIFEELQRAHPKYCFLMEESGAVEGENKDYCWIIDPLDGTTNFLHGIPHWAISIALQVKGEVMFGLVYDPVKDEMFTAEKNGGAFIHRNKRLRVSGRRDAMLSMAISGAPRHAVKSQEQFAKEYKAMQTTGVSLRRMGAAALDLAYVAAGRAEVFWERSLKPWDVAAGMLIVREAGGFIAEIDNDKNDPLKTGNIIASNSGLFEQSKKVLRSCNK